MRAKPKQNRLEPRNRRISNLAPAPAAASARRQGAVAHALRSIATAAFSSLVSKSRARRSRLSPDAISAVARRLARFFLENPDYRLSTDRSPDRRHAAPRAGAEDGRTARRAKTFSRVNLVRRARPAAAACRRWTRCKWSGCCRTEIDITITERKPIAWITSEKEMADPFVVRRRFPDRRARRS